MSRRHDSPPLPSPPLHSLLSLPSRFSLHCIIPFTNTSRLCGKKKTNPHPLSRLIPIPSSSKHNFSQWQHIYAACLAIVSPRPPHTEKPRPVAAPNRLRHHLSTTSIRHPQGACHRRQCQARASHSINFKTTIPRPVLWYRHHPFVIQLPTAIAAHPSIGLRATTSHIIRIIMVRDFLSPYP